MLSAAISKMRFLDGDIFPVALAIISIDVVDVVSDLPLPPEAIEPADVGPAVDVAWAEAISVESVIVAPDVIPACADAASNETTPTLTPIEEITTTLPATHAATDEVQVVRKS